MLSRKKRKEEPLISPELQRQRERAALDEFLETTKEGQQISGHRQTLFNLNTKIGSERLGYTMPGVTIDLDDHRTLEEQYGEYLADNYVDVDFALLQTDKTYAKVIYELLRDCRIQLETTATRMLHRPDLRIGTYVSVERTPKEGEERGKIEQNWVIDSVLATGRLKVRSPFSDTQDLTKDLAIEELEKWNPQKSIRRRLGSAARSSR